MYDPNRSDLQNALLVIKNLSTYLDAMFTRSGQRGGTEMPGSKYLGKALPRLEDADLVTGSSTFTDDIKIPDCLYLVIVRSPYPHAVIRKIETSSAHKIPGFLAAYNGADLKAWLKPIPLPPQSANVRPHSRYPLAIDRVRYVGEGVVAIVGESLAAAVDAAAEVIVEYD